MTTEAPYTSLKTLLAAKKGRTTFLPGESFLLHVFWESPSLDAARELLQGLAGCAKATERDTPCVPTYFFRISEIASGICAEPPRTVGEHPHLVEARRKRRMGVPAPAVRAGLVKLGLDPGLAELEDAGVRGALARAVGAAARRARELAGE